MDHYQRHLILDADPATVYAAVTTSKGLRGWWTPDCETDTHAGGTARFHFGSTYKDMSIERLDMNREVRWFCTRAFIAKADLARKDEWVGTEIVFRLTPTTDGKTRLDFEHIGLVPTLECYDLCNNGWNYFLGSLQQFVDSGRGTPWAPVQCAA